MNKLSMKRTRQLAIIGVASWLGMLVEGIIVGFFYPCLASNPTWLFSKCPPQPSWWWFQQYYAADVFIAIFFVALFSAAIFGNPYFFQHHKETVKIA